MARPFKKQGGTATLTCQYYCTYCEKWRDRSEFTEEDAYTADDHIGEHDGEEYYRDCNSYTVWTCDHCCEIISVDEEPRKRTSAEVWVCGECKDEYYDADEAQECCE